MYPSLPGASSASYGSAAAGPGPGSLYGPPPPLPPTGAGGGGGGGASAGGDASPWAGGGQQQEPLSTLRVRIADEYRLAPPVQMPPALVASSRPPPDFDFEVERRVLAADGGGGGGDAAGDTGAAAADGGGGGASASAAAALDAFLARPEESYYEGTRAAKFVRAGFSPATVNLALAYHAAAAHRGGGGGGGNAAADEAQITAFCDNLRTLTQEMSFATPLAAGALVRAKNDLSAAADLITELS